MRITTLIILIFIVSFITIMPSQVTWACTGPPYQTIDFKVENAEYIVKAHIVEMDDANQNAILRVEQYLMGGSGPEYILWHRVSPVLSSVYGKHNYDTSCTYGGENRLSGYPLYISESVNIPAYYALSRSRDGSYHSVGFYADPMYYAGATHIPRRIDPNNKNEDDYSNWQNVEIADEQEFINLIAELSGETPVEPTDSPYPYLAPIRITTDTGNQYMFPVDRGDLIRIENAAPIEPSSMFKLSPFCAEVGCEIQSPDLSLYAGLADTNLVYVDYPYRWKDSDSEYLITLEGQAVAFSMTGDVITIWNDDKLEIYFVSNADCNCVYGELIPELRIVTEIPLAIDDHTPIESLYGQAVWSASGAALAYADAEGVWVYDLIHQGIPELLVEDALPLFVSNSGRYVGYTTEDKERGEWSVVDRVSPESHIDNSMIPPDEGRSIVIRDADYFEWIDNLAYFKVEGCAVVNAECSLTVDNLTYERLGRYTFTYTGPIYDVDYDSEQGLFVLAPGPQAISIGDTRYELYEYVFDMTEQIDGSIVDVQWMPSLFYRKD